MTMAALIDLLTPNGATLIAATVRYGIGSPLEQAHFYAQCAHESAGFTRLHENLNYSSVGLLSTFPTHFNAVDAGHYARQPERIANRVYASRMGNGDEASGDGWRFRGRGFIQLTGKHNYGETSNRMFSDARLLTQPELLEDPLHAAMSAGDFWLEHHCGLPALHDDIEHVTRYINGGTTGLDDRRVWLKRFKLALGLVA